MDWKLFLDKTKKTARININVVRPSRTNEEINITLTGPNDGLRHRATGMSQITKDLLKRNVIDSTLFSTLQGFCEIRSSDI